jgi:GxxExxY protein
MTKSYLKNLIYQVNGAAIEVHKNIGPGLLESVYHKCMEKELTYRGISFQTELRIPIQYKDFSIEADLKCDLVIEEMLIIELKSVKKILQIHEAQILTYMKLLEVPMGLLINFNVTNIYKEGQKTYVNELYRHLED